MPWAPDPTTYPRDFTGKHYRDHLQFIANRLGREEAESLPPVLRRMFAIGSSDAAPLPNLEHGSSAAVAEQRLILGDLGGIPIVNGVEKDRLTNAQWETIKALLDSGERGLTKDALASKSNHTDAVGIIDRLRKRDEGWASVILMAGKPGGRYRIER